MKVLKTLIENLYITYFYIKEKLKQKIDQNINIILVGEKHNSLFHSKLKDLIIKIYEPEVVLYECPKTLSMPTILKLIELLKKKFGIQDLSKDYNLKECIENSLKKQNLDEKISSRIMNEIVEIVKEYGKYNKKKISIENILDLDFLEFNDFVTYFRTSLINKCYSEEKERYKLCDEDNFPKLFEDLKKCFDINLYSFINNYLPTFRIFEKLINKYKKDIICVDDYSLEDKYIEFIKKVLSDVETKESLNECQKKVSDINKEREKRMTEEILKYVKEKTLQNKKLNFVFIGGKLHIENIENYLKRYDIKTRKIILPEISMFSNKFEDDIHYLISLIKN